ncbi:hypothetical protein Q8G41_27650, partial [Klebsiella pneumoniae]|uniref:hypothetical protein n=1 Tax=Klebsiella pneumoniae TaxID=573 RepID=UPI003013B139
MSGNVEQLQEVPQVSYEQVFETLQNNFHRVFEINELLWQVVEAGRELVAAQVAIDLLCLNVRAEQS